MLALFLQQASVVAHYEMAIDFLDQVEGDADGNQQTGTAVEACDDVIHAERARDDRRDNSDDRQEPGADVSDADHYFFEVIGRTLAGAIPRDERAEVFQV